MKRPGHYNFTGFYRSRHGIFLGVCEGIARRLDWSPWGLRLLMIVLQCTIFPFAILVYFALALVMRREPVERFESMHGRYSRW
jgi:phage shock protein PspC (stress-responsive transcriptional regulator)